MCKRAAQDSLWSESNGSVSVVCRFFQCDASGRILQQQRGVIRTNCMDNLDRTNVVQVSPAAAQPAVTCCHSVTFAPSPLYA